MLIWLRTRSRWPGLSSIQPVFAAHLWAWHEDSWDSKTLPLLSSSLLLVHSLSSISVLAWLWSPGHLLSPPPIF